MATINLRVMLMFFFSVICMYRMLSYRYSSFVRFIVDFFFCSDISAIHRNHFFPDLNNRHILSSYIEILKCLNQFYCNSEVLYDTIS